MSTGNCSSRSRCGNARTCDFCARARQQKLANYAEHMEKQHGQLTLTVLCPDKNSQQEINRLRASFVRRSLAPAGIWTVETGSQFNGLHLNILSPRPAPARWRDCKTYSELVQTTSREAAAYIAKRSGMPQPEQYAGRLMGTFGQLFTFLASDQVPPTVQAAAIELTLSGKGDTMTKAELDKPKSTPANDPANWYEDAASYDPNKPSGYCPNNPEESNPPWRRRALSLDERREIMRRHLPGIYAAIGKNLTTVRG